MILVNNLAGATASGLGSKLSLLTLMLLISTLWTVSPGQLLAGESIDQTLAAQSDGFVRVNVVRGSLDIEGWDKDEIEVEGELDEQTKKFIFEVRDDETIISVKIKKLKSWCCNNGSDLKIKVPRNSRLDVSVVSTDVDVEDIYGGLELGSVSGEIRIENIAGRIKISSVSGEISARDLSGRTRIKSVSGDIEVESAKGIGRYHSVSGNLELNEVGHDLDLETVSGDIELDDSDVISVRGHTVSGDIDLDVKLLDDAVVDFDTLSGSVRLHLGGNIEGRYRLETASGSIRNRLTDHEAHQAKYIRDKTLRFTMGDSDAEINVSTRSGDIVIAKQ